jgi:hypothetical protein
MSFIDFSVVKEAISFTDAIDYLNLEKTMKRAGSAMRGPCPCRRGGDRGLIITPGEGWFCHGASFGGDVIALAKHVLDLPNMREAAFELAERAGIHTGTGTSNSKSTSRQVPSRTVPESGREQSPNRPRGAEKSAPQPSRGFDPSIFAQKLQYTAEVEALGVSEDDATALGIGFYRGKLYQALRYSNGDVAGYSALANGELKLPASLVPMTNVVALKRA